MNLSDTILNRRSVRAFLPDTVSRSTVSEIIELARWAPSWGNTQPWEIIVADGEKAKRLARAFETEGMKKTPPRPDIPMPMEFSGLYKDRYMTLGRNLLESMGIEREDKQARFNYYLSMYAFFGASTIIYLAIDGNLNVPYSCLDIGSIGVTICHAAMEYGLGTIFLAASVHFPDIVKQTLDIPKEKKLVIGIAMGYPDKSKPAAIFRSDRESIESVCRFA